MSHNIASHRGDPPITIKGGSLKIHSKVFLNTEQEGEHFTYESKVKVEKIVVTDSLGQKYVTKVEDGEFKIEFYLKRRRR